MNSFFQDESSGGKQRGIGNLSDASNPPKDGELHLKRSNGAARAPPWDHLWSAIGIHPYWRHRPACGAAVRP